MNRHLEDFQEEVVSCKGPAGPLISPGLDIACAVGVPILVPRQGDTLGGALLTGSTQSVGRGAPAARVFAEAPALQRWVPAGGRPVTHDVTDNDTSRVSQSDAAPELHNVTPGTPGTSRPWR